MRAAVERHGWSRTTVAVVAAYVIALQTLLTAFSAAAAPAPILEQGPGIISTGHADPSGRPDPFGQNDHDGQCCILHCLGSTWIAGPGDVVLHAAPHRPPVVHRTATLAVRDATIYNDFAIGQEADALTLVNAPTACTARIEDAGDSEPEAPETFWEAVVWLLTQKLQDLGVMAKPGDPSDRFLIACPRPS